jgi:hypothetical protein
MQGYFNDEFTKQKLDLKEGEANSGFLNCGARHGAAHHNGPNSHTAPTPRC